MQIIKYFFLIILNVMIVYPQVYNMNVNLVARRFFLWH